MLLAASGECLPDPTYFQTDCLTEHPLEGSVNGQSMAVNAFAYVSVPEGGLALVGFEGQKNACQIVEEHVAEVNYWHDGLVLDMAIRGTLIVGEDLLLVERVSQDPEQAEMSIRVAETDVFEIKATSGSAAVTAFEEGGDLSLTNIEADFQPGKLTGDIKACHCPDLKDFWDIQAPDIVD